MLPGENIPWYLSQTFWTIAAVAVGLIAILISTWAAFRAANPRRRLYIYVSEDTPLLTAKDIGDSLEVRHNGIPINNPRLTQVSVVNHSRLDIPSDRFDGDRPVTLELNAEVVELLKTSPKGQGRNLPELPVSVEGTKLRLGPGIIGKTNSITFTLLTDGPAVLTAESPLINIDTRYTAPPPKRLMSGAIAATLAVVIGMLVVTLAATTSARSAQAELREAMLRSGGDDKVLRDDLRRDPDAARPPQGSGPWPFVVVDTGPLGLFVRTTNVAESERLGSVANRSLVYVDCISLSDFTPPDVGSIDVGPQWAQVRWRDLGLGTHIGISAPDEKQTGWMYVGALEPIGHNGELPQCYKG